MTDSVLSVYRWVELGERLQLDYFKAKAMAFIKEELEAGRVELLLEVVRMPDGPSTLAAEVAAIVPASVQVVCERCREITVLPQRYFGASMNDPRQRLYELFCTFCGQRFCLVPAPDA